MMAPVGDRMISGHISLEGARCQLLAAEASRVVDGLTTDVAIKKVRVWDPESGVEVHLLFTNGEFSEFMKTLKGEE